CILWLEPGAGGYRVAVCTVSSAESPRAVSRPAPSIIQCSIESDSVWKHLPIEHFDLAAIVAAELPSEQNDCSTLMAS
ncbi:hypothetical protein J6590_036175, partial [Homalodisca vitripennis]